MNKTLYLTLLLLTFGLAAGAQTITTGIAIESVQTRITGEQMELSLRLRAEGLDMRCDGRMTIEFAVENADRRLVLPTVVYSGKQRYRYEQRRELLSGGYNTAPYHTYNGVKRDKRYELDYRLTIPYYTWMEHAGVTYRQYVHDCGGEHRVADGQLIADLNPAPAYVEPEIWAPDPTLFANIVSFLVPEVEEVKARASMLTLNIGFPVNVTEVRPAFGNNAHELGRADSLVRALQSSDLININAVNIRGYASPEGRYEANERLARGRSESFKQYLTRNYPQNTYIRDAYTSWVAEDWDGFGRLVEQSDIPSKQDVLAIVYDRSIAPDAKDRMLQNIVWWSANYKIILQEMYPKLRRIELRVDYTVSKIADSRARELIHTQPGLLSLEEIYRVARYYEPGSKQYREVYEIAARQYPADVIANNNAAAALLQEGNAAAALPYLEKTKDSPMSCINYGAYYYIGGDLDKALEYFNKAKDAGIEQGALNLKLVTPGQR